MVFVGFYLCALCRIRLAYSDWGLFDVMQRMCSLTVRPASSVYESLHVWHFSWIMVRCACVLVSYGVGR